MKLKNVKRGVRVELKDTTNIRVPTGTKGTILQSNVHYPYVEWDNFTDGHSNGNPTVPNSCWAVEIPHLRRIKD